MSVMRRDPVLPATALFLFGVLLGPARADGGFTSLSWGAGTVALSAFSLAVVLTREVRIGALELLAGSAFALYAAWTALSLLWTSSVPLSIPNLPVLNGLHVYAQSLTFTPGFNAFGALTSNGVDLGIGNQ